MGINSRQLLLQVFDFLNPKS